MIAKKNQFLDREREEDLWKAYRKVEAGREESAPPELRKQFIQARNDLMVFYQPLVSTCASGRKCPQIIEDLITEGNLSLLELFERFDPSKGVKFTSYCIKRIIGAMQDYQRSQDSVPRLTRKREGKREKIERDLVNKGGYAHPLDVQTRMSPEDYRDSFPRETVSLQSKVSNGNRGRGVMLLDTIGLNEDPGLTVLEEDLREYMMRGLSRAERIILAMKHERISMKKIGEVVGVCESRISQQFSSLKKRLKQKTKDFERSYS